jgi:hypothetical protein
MQIRRPFLFQLLILSTKDTKKHEEDTYRHRICW